MNHSLEGYQADLGKSINIRIHVQAYYESRNCASFVAVNCNYQVVISVNVDNSNYSMHIFTN
jgi:hypothetical protein